jgi:hypothetical protein
MRYPLSLAAVVFLTTALPLHAKTLVLTDADCDEMASISADAPRLGWAGGLFATAEWSNHVIDITPKNSFLIRYPIDRIPAGHRITKAEWIVPFSQAHPPGGVRLQVRRLLVPWGAGVSFDTRMVRPEKHAWHTPGARGLGKDRAAKASATATARGAGELTFNVTEDVELWYTGVAKNHGWILTAEDEATFFRASSPFWGSPKGWKLRITYEPE